MTPFQQGFINKCAEYGLSIREAGSLYKLAQVVDSDKYAQTREDDDSFSWPSAAAQTTGNPAYRYQNDDPWDPGSGYPVVAPHQPVQPQSAQPPTPQPAPSSAAPPTPQPAPSSAAPPTPQPAPSLAAPANPKYTPEQMALARMWSGMNANERNQYLADRGVTPAEWRAAKAAKDGAAQLAFLARQRSSGSLPYKAEPGKQRRTGIFEGGREVMVDDKGNFRAQGYKDHNGIVHGIKDPVTRRYLVQTPRNFETGGRLSRRAAAQQQARLQRPVMRTAEWHRRNNYWNSHPDEWRNLVAAHPG